MSDIQDKPDDLILPDRVLLRFQQRGDARLGFMTPYDPDDPSMQSRDDTVLEWAASRDANMIERVPHIMQNAPQTGFKIQHMVRRWSNDNKVWRIEDPRGFELEIPSENLDYLFNHCTIKDRTFQEELIWMNRIRGNTNWLVPTSTPDLEAIRELTQLRSRARTSDPIPLKDVNRGDVVRLYDGRTVRYFGSAWCQEVGRMWGNTSVSRYQWFEIIDGNTFVTGVYNKMDEGLSYMSSLKIVEIVEAADPPMTKEEVEDEINRLLATPNSKTSGVAFVRIKKFSEEDLEPTMHDNKPAYRLGDKIFQRYTANEKDTRRRRHGN